MLARQPHGRQLKRTLRQTADLGRKRKVNRWMIHPSFKLGLIVSNKADWKEVGGGDRDKCESATFRADTKGPSYQSRKYRG